MIVNAGHPEGNDDLEQVLGRDHGRGFPTVLRDPIEPTNTLLLGTEAPASAADLERARRASSRPSSAASRDRGGADRPRASTAAPSTPTTRRRSSG